MRNGAHDYISKPFDRSSPVLRVRDAVELWSCRERERTALNWQANENSEWVRLTQSEKDMLLLARLMQN
jgi:FixJ family two-component response regulator